MTVTGPGGVGKTRLVINVVREVAAARRDGGLFVDLVAVSDPVTNQDALFPMLLGFALLIIWKHRENILRLKKGTEPRIGSKT